MLILSPGMTHSNRQVFYILWARSARELLSDHLWALPTLLLRARGSSTSLGIKDSQWSPPRKPSPRFSQTPPLGMFMRAVVPSLFGTRDQFRGRQFFHSGVCVCVCVCGFLMIREHDIYCALYFFYYYSSSTSDHQALDPRGWGPLL